MHTAILDLFHYSLAEISDQHIVDFSPSDPGYHNYVREWRSILTSKSVPKSSNFDLSEVIGLTGWSDPGDWDSPLRFLEYRRFTSSVALVLYSNGIDGESVRPANYLARDLMVDLDVDSDQYVIHVTRALSATRNILISDGHEEDYPFFTLALLILAQRREDWSESERLAIQLIEDENRVRNDDNLNYCIENDSFLLGITIYDQVHKDWVVLAKELSNPTNHMDTQLVIDSLKST